MGDIGKLLKQISDVFSQMSIGARVSFFVTMLVCLVGFGFVFWSASRPDFALLAARVTPEDASEMIENLESAGIPYELRAGGTQIFVPRDQVYSLRLKLAGEGLPKSGSVGFEIFDEPGFGVSQFIEKLNYRRALEGELRRTIKQIDAVRDARVHIVIPERNFFRDSQQKASAAVTVALAHGRTLGNSQVKSILHLVAAAVPDLQLDAITVVDTLGNTLANGSEAGGFSTVFAQQRALEKSLEDRIVEILTPVVGVGKVIARVSAAMDFSQINRTSEHFEPGDKAVRSEQIRVEEAENKAAANTGGIPGVRSNVDGTERKEDPAPANDNRSSKRTESRNFEVSKVVQREVLQAGKIKRLSVAVVVDGIVSVGEDGKKTVSERSSDEINRLEQLVRRAVGYDLDREDQVLVQSMPFEIFEEEAEPPADKSAYWISIAQRGAPILLGIVLFFFFVSTVKRFIQAADKLRSERQLTEAQQSLLRNGPVSVNELERRMGALPAGGSRLAELPAPDSATLVIREWLNQA